MKYLYTLLTVSLVGSLLLAPPAPAVELAESGKIDIVNLKGGYLVVDDGKFRLAQSVRVYSQFGAAVPVSALKPGMRITFNLDPQSSANVITDLAILSSN